MKDISIIITEKDLPGDIVQTDDTVFGKLRIRGTRMYISLIVELLTSGMSNSEILEEYPTLKKEDIAAVLSFMSTIAKKIDRILVDRNELYR